MKNVWNKNYPFRVAICFFGITRSLTYTIDSIERNVLRPARELAAEVRIFAHFYEQDWINNPRTGEFGSLNTEEYTLLSPDWLELETPGTALERWSLERLKENGDAWENDFASLSNLVHQLNSLYYATNAALDAGFDIVIFCRPDLKYIDSMGPPIRKLFRSRCPTVLMPYWQPFWGCNDRFALCIGEPAIRSYGLRILKADDFCRETALPLHSERLLAYSLESADLTTGRISTRASRVRSDGSQVEENFDHPLYISLRNRLLPTAKRIFPLSFD